MIHGSKSINVIKRKEEEDLFIPTPGEIFTMDFGYGRDLFIKVVKSKAICLSDGTWMPADENAARDYKFRPVNVTITAREI